MENLPAYGSFIGGKWDYEGESRPVVSPGDGSIIATVVDADRHKTGEAVESAQKAFDVTWQHFSLTRRKRILAALASSMQERSEEFASLESMNTGKVIRQSAFMDVPLAIECINYYAGLKVRFRRRLNHPEFPGTRGVVEHLPMGVVGAIAPWNVPLLMAVWKTIPALLAGNTVVLKPSHHTPVTAFEFARQAKRAGLPDGVLNVVTGSGEEVGRALCEDRRVSMLSFTGSTETGKRVLSSASGTIKKVTLELGGKSPNIVFADAPLERAVKGVLFGIYLNSGQLCESGSRLLVESSIKERFLDELRKRADSMRCGNPMDMDTDISAITTSAQRVKIRDMVDDAVSKGANACFRKQIDGSVPPHGLFYPPTILTGVTEEMRIARHETFGPVLACMDFEDEEEATAMANDSNYGLAGGVWSGDEKKAMRVAKRIRAGTVWINDYHMLSAAAPRGGFKESGIGRELGIEGLMEFTQTRHLFIGDSSGSLDDIAYGLVVPDR